MPRRPWPDRGSLSHRVTTDEEGRFTVPDEVSLPFGLTATAGLGSGSAGIIDDRESPLTITVKPSAIIVRGRVRDETGRVVGGVPVEVFQVPSEEIVFGTETDPKGGFVLVLPPAMSHLATVSPADRPRTLLRLESRAQSVNITVPNRPRPRPPETDLRAWLTSSVWPIRSTTPTGVVTDLAPVARAVEGARVIGLGEVTHGSKEIVQLKQRLVEVLAQLADVRAIALETGYAETLALNRFVVTGEGDPEQRVKELVATPWETRSFLAFVNGLHQINRQRARPIELVGVDVSSWKATRMLLAYLDEVGRLAESIRAPLAPLSHWSAGNGKYANLPSAQQAAAREALQALDTLLDAERADLQRKRGRSSWDEAKRLVREIKRAERSYRDPVLRDTLLAENVLHVEKQMGGLVLIWAHNAHVTKAPTFYQDMGRRLKQALGEGYIAVGTAFGQGGVRALTKPGHGGPSSVTTGPPHQDGFDAVLSSFAKASQRRAFAIDLRAAPEGAVRRWLDSPIPTWTIGFAYQNDDLARQLIAPRKSFDILVFANEVRATEPL